MDTPRIYLIVLILTSFCWSGEKINLKRSSPDLPAQENRVTMTLFNINNISGWISYDGRSGSTPDNEPGTFFPRGTAPVVYADGVLFGGYARDENLQNPRVGGATYHTGLTPGWKVTPGSDGAESAVAVDPDDPRVMIYRIRRDW
jgi:hypothetical protein